MKIFSNKVIIIFVLFVLLGTAFNFCLRNKLSPIFDETQYIQFIQKLVDLHEIKSTERFFKTYWNDIWHESHDQPSRRPLKVYYRPIQVIIMLWQILTCHIFSDRAWLPILCNSLILSLAAACVYLLGYRLTKDHFCSAGGAFFMMLSLPALVGTWVGIPGNHAFVPLLVCLNILSYLNYKKSHSKIWIIPIVLIGFFGPLFRETSIVGLAVIFFSELISSRRSWRFLLLMIPLVLHSLSPAFIINLVFYNNTIISSTLDLKQVLTKVILFILQFQCINHLCFVVPPVVPLLGVFSILINYCKENNKSRQFLLYGIILAGLLYGSLFVPINNPAYLTTKYLLFILAVFISFSALKIHPVLAIWSFFSWLPHVIIFWEVHLIYTIGPFVIILLWHIKQLTKKLFSATHNKLIYRGAGILVILLLFISAVDQGANAWSCYHVFREANKSAIQIARKIVQDLPRGKKPILISSTLLGDDVGYYLSENEGMKFKVNGYTFSGAVQKENVYEDEAKFFDLLDKEKDAGCVYLLDKEGGATLLSKFRKKMGQKISKIHVYRSEVFYPYLDILKYFIPLDYFSYPGSTDHRDHFTYHQGLFYRGVSVEYVLWKVENEI